MLVPAAALDKREILSLVYWGVVRFGFDGGVSVYSSCLAAPVVGAQLTGGRGIRCLFNPAGA